MPDLTVKFMKIRRTQIDLKIVISLTLGIMLAWPVSAYEPDSKLLVASMHFSSQVGTVSWNRLAPKKEEFSVLMPGSASVYVGSTYLRPGPYDTNWVSMPVRIYNVISDKTLFVIQSYESPNLKSLRDTLFNSDDKFFKFEQDVKSNGFKGKRFVRSKTNIFGAGEYFLTKHHLYVIEAVRRDSDSPLIDQFLTSFNLESNNESPVEALVSQSEFSMSQNPVYEINNQPEIRKAVILWKPEADFTPESSAARELGTVKLSIVLSSNGRVSGIEVLSSLRFGVTEQAIEAAKRVIFLPAEREGRFISQRVVIEYTYS
jgi:TonB family protein